MEGTIKKVKKILEEVNDETPKYNYSKRKYQTPNSFAWGKEYCPICDKPIIIPVTVKDPDIGDYIICNNCFEQFY